MTKLDDNLKSNDLNKTEGNKYAAPRVSDLGAWQAVTLIYSVPVNPTGAIFKPSGNENV